MKKVMIVVIGLVSLQFLKAQDSTSFSSKKNEINIGYFNLFSLSSNNNMGIGYKRVIGSGAFRIGTSLDYDNYETKGSTDTTEQKGITIVPRVGYEFRQNYNRFMVYYGADLCGSISKSNYSYQNDPYSYKNDGTTYGVGLSPFIGVKYFINKNISVSTETSFNFMYSFGKTENSSTNQVTQERNTKNMSAKLSPLGIVSINFHF